MLSITHIVMIIEIIKWHVVVVYVEKDWAFPNYTYQDRKGVHSVNKYVRLFPFLLLIR